MKPANPRAIVLADRWRPSDRERLAQPPAACCSVCSHPVVLGRALALQVRARPHRHRVVCTACQQPVQQP